MMEWERDWHVVAREWIGRRFAHGASDCVHYADRYAEVRGLPRASIPHYSTAIGATVLVSHYGSMVGVGEALLMRPPDYMGDESVPGDIVIYDQSFAVRLRRWLAAPADDVGLRFRGVFGVVCGWHT